MTLEEKLIQSLKTKDRIRQEEVFEEIYYYYYNLIRFCISKYIRRNEDIEELLNDVFLNFFNHLDKIEVKNIKYYLTTTAKNLSLNFLRDNKKDLSVELDDEIVFGKEEEIDNSFMLDLKRSLDKIEYYILVEHSIYGRNCNDIAKDINLTPGAVRIKYHRIIKKIRKEFGTL